MNNSITHRKKIALLILYFVGYLFVAEWLLSSFVYPNFGYTWYLLTSTLIEATMFLIVVFVLNDWFAKEWKVFRQNIGQSLKSILFYVFLLYAVSFVFNLLIALPFHLTEAENQINAETMMSMNSIGFIVNALIIAPIIEEVIFRGCIFDTFANKWGILIGALISGGIFGLLHIGASVMQGNWLNLLYILDYGGCGMVLSFAYGKSHSIWTSIIVHMCFNFIGVLFMI